MRSIAANHQPQRPVELGKRAHRPEIHSIDDRCDHDVDELIA
jgi:hypothetical protein